LADLRTPAAVAATKAALDRTLVSTGGNDLGVAVRAGIEQLRGAVDEGRPRIGVLVSDGPGPISDTTIDEAVDNDVVYYTVGVGGGDMSRLRTIATRTGGRFIALSDVAQLSTVYGELRRDLVDPGTDADSDGVTDCVERRGALVAHGFYGPDQPFKSGRYARTDPNDPDTDNDTLSDGAELGPLKDITLDPQLAETYEFLVANGIRRFYNPSSDPTRQDTDGEGLHDQDERVFNTNAYLPDTDGDGSNDYDEVRAGITSLIRPEFNQYPWLYDVMGWSTESGDCAFECLAINEWAQAEFQDQGWFCKLMTTCQPDDLRQEWIQQAVDAQELFTYQDGHMRKEFVRDFFAYNCQRIAARGEECFSQAVEEKAEGDYHYQDLVQALAEVLTNLPGGRRPPDPEVDQATTKLDRLAKQACGEIKRLPDETPSAYGTRVHQRFEELISQLADPTLFGETGYRNGQVVSKVGDPPRWPDGTTAPDAVFGSPNSPKAAYDLKTGEKPIQGKWIRDFLNNLLGLVPFGNTVELIELTC
jgi:hypothetical protein